MRFWSSIVCILCVVYVFKSIFLAVGIAAGAFFSGKMAGPRFLDMSNLRNLCILYFLTLRWLWGAILGGLGDHWSSFCDRLEVWESFGILRSDLEGAAQVRGGGTRPAKLLPGKRQGEETGGGRDYTTIPHA